MKVLLLNHQDLKEQIIEIIVTTIEEEEVEGEEIVEDDDYID